MTSEVTVPDVGEAEDVEVVEILVAVGDSVAVDDSLVVLESDKASMEIPSPFAGTIASIAVKVGDEVNEGDLLLAIEAAEGEAASVEAEKATAASAATTTAASETPAASEVAPDEPATASLDDVAVEQIEPDPASSVALASSPAPDSAGVAGDADAVHAGPAVRKEAREYGVVLSEVTGSGRLGRILKEDIQAHVKKRLAGATGASGGSGIPPIPDVDFSRQGEIEIAELSRIRRASARNLHRSWLNVPHVTQFDEADITDLETFRKEQNQALAADGVKLTPLAFLIRACVKALQDMPRFNASIASDYSHLVLKRYYNIGIAVETPDGLMVPVLKQADQKGLAELATETATLAAQARDGKLPMDAMQGATFTISSLGGIGGTKFTPIVNAPEVAILGVSRSKVTPQWDGEQFKPRTMLPLSLSYDHRAIDGAEAARFTHYLGLLLSDLRRVLV